MNVYIDLGAHTGKTVETWMVQHPGDVVYAFEPNPACLRNPRWVALREHYQQLTIMPVAAWTEETSLHFYRDSMHLASQGGTVMLGKTTGEVSYDAPIQVRAIDFSAWLEGVAAGPGRVTVKMDIEGAEFNVVEKMIGDGTIGLVDRLLIEFHAEKFKDNGLAIRQRAIMRALEAARVEVEVADH